MSTNKNANIRYQTLDKCFRNSGRMYFAQDLLDECNKAIMEYDNGSSGIQIRQLYNDISYMESEAGWSIPLQRLQYGKKTYYRYEDLSFSINNNPLNVTEVEQIKTVLKIFSRFSGIPKFEWVNETIPMLESKFGFIQKNKEVISFDSNIDLKGLEYLTPLFNAIVNERVMEVDYKDFKSSDSYKINFHPYYLKQFNNRWFALGFNQEKDFKFWNIALDRINELKETSLKYQESETDWDDYFSEIIGVSKPFDVSCEKIILKFNSNIAPYVITKPLHRTQKHKYNNEVLEVSIEVIPNFELEQTILSFGENVEVISPDYLKEKIKNRLSQAFSLYNI